MLIYLYIYLKGALPLRANQRLIEKTGSNSLFVVRLLVIFLVVDQRFILEKVIRYEDTIEYEIRYDKIEEGGRGETNRY